MPGDRDGILAVVRDAFTSDDRDASEEVDIVLSTWERRPEPSRLELVAVADDAIVGHVLAAGVSEAATSSPSPRSRCRRHGKARGSAPPS
jgi:predicted N-acetyltransferase YhbS